MRLLPYLPVLLALLPLPAAAQLLDPVPGEPRFSVSAYTGLRAPYTTGFLTAVQPDGTAAFSATEQRGGSPLLGVDAAVRLFGPVSLVLGGAYSEAGVSDFYLDREPQFRDTVDFRLIYPGNTWFAKAALSARFQSPPQIANPRPRPASEIFAGAGMLRMIGSSHPALNLGFKGAFPVGVPGLEIVVGIEDYLVFWNHDAFSTDLAGVLSIPEQPLDLVQFYYDTSNVVLLRAGFAMQL